MRTVSGGGIVSTDASALKKTTGIKKDTNTGAREVQEDFNNSESLEPSIEQSSHFEHKKLQDWDSAPNALSFDMEKLNPPLVSKDSTFKVASLSLRQKDLLHQHRKSMRENLDALKRLGELPTLKDPLDRADALLEIAHKTKGMTQRDYVQLSMKLNQFKRGYQSLDSQALKDLAKDFAEAAQRGKEQRAFSNKVEKAFTLFDDGSLLTDMYQVIQLGDIKPLQSTANYLKQNVAESVEALYQAGGASAAVGIFADTTANTIIDIWMPTNALDVVGTGVAIRGALKSLPRTQAILRELADKRVEGIMYEKGKLTVGSVNLLKNKVPFTADQKRTLVLLKMAELADATQAKNAAQISAIMRELDSSIVKDTLADMAAQKIIDFADKNLVFSSASYKAGSDIEKSVIDVDKKLRQQIRELF